MAHRVDTESRGGRTICTLHDDATGAAAAILPSYGFNLYSLKLPAAGRVREVLHASSDFADDPKSPGRNGTPVLFPFPNRIKAGHFRYGDKDYQLPLNSKPHAIHGFAISAPWDVVEHKADDQGAHLVGRFQISKNSPEMRQYWPTDAVLQIRYSLSGRRLSMTITVSNPSAEELPYGFGIHPYFRLPIEPDGEPGRTRVILPASKYWALAGYIPGGETRPVDDHLDFRNGKPLDHLKLDDVLTGLAYEGDRGACRLVDGNIGAELRLGFDRHFRELVVFTPPTEGVIAVEPYTQTTDAINLDARGIDAGLRRLWHGQQETMTLVMETAG